MLEEVTLSDKPAYEELDLVNMLLNILPKGKITTIEMSPAFFLKGWMKKSVSYLFILLLFFPIDWLYAAEGITELRVGLFQNEPIVFQDNQGKPKGLYVDLLKEIARLEGWKLTFVHDSWNNCIERLHTNEIDLMTSIAYTKEREAYINFSKEIVWTLWGTVYGQPKSDIQNVMDLKDKTVAVMKEGIVGIQFKKLCKKFNVNCEFIETASQDESLGLLT